MPPRVRSERTSLSNCAKAASTPSISLPVDVSSIGSVAERSEIPSDFRWARSAKWSYFSRAKRVRLKTTTNWTRPLVRVRAEISTIDISDLTHYPSFRGPSDQPAWAAVARVFMGLSAEQTAVRQASAILLEFCLERRQSRNSNIMRPLSFDPNVLRQHLRRHTIATLDELKRALGTPVDVTVFRKLQTLDYLSSYSHRGAYYTLRPLARFSPEGLWSHEGVWFSRSGTLVATAEAFVTQSSSGYFADELARALHVEVHVVPRPGSGRAIGICIRIVPARSGTSH